MRRSAALLAALLCAAVPLQAAPAPPPAAAHALDLFDLGAPRFANFSARDGVPESVSVSIQTDRDGFVWVSSPLGLARYDGHHWNMAPGAGMPAAQCALTLDHEGILWAAYRDQGIAHYDGTRWVLENRASGLDSNQFRRVAEIKDAAGDWQLWAVGWEHGLLRREHGSWIADAGNAQLPAGPILALAQTQRIGGGSRQWAGTFNEGVWFRDVGGSWQKLQRAHFEPSQVEHLFVTEHDGHEELWISAFGSGLWRLRDDDALREWSKQSGDLPTDELYDITLTPLPDGDRAIWVGSRSGLVRIHDDRAQVYDRRHGLPSDVVRGLSAWRSPNGIEVLWLATESGVSRTIVGVNQWLTASLAGAHAIGVFGVFVDSDTPGDERLWVGAAADGLNLYEQGRWRHFGVAEGLPDTDVRMIKRVADEHAQAALWLGLRGGHLLRIADGPRFETVATPWERHPGQAVMDMLARQIDGGYEQWFATRQSGIYRKRGTQWTAFRPPTVSGQWRIDRLLEQIDGSGKSWLWATTNQGLARFDGSRWDLLGREQGLPDVELLGMSLLKDASGGAVLWLGTAHAGITRIAVSDPLHPAVLPGDLPAPPDLTAYGALQDSVGRIYICTNNGVQQLTPDASGYAARVFSRRDGMVHDECNTNAQFIDAHDRFWTGTLGGLTVFDPQREIRDAQPKALKLTDMRVDGVAQTGGNLRLASDVREVRIEYALLSWQREGESRFRTQLLGYEAQPGAWTAQNFRDFNSLPPGNYLLRVEAQDYAGNRSQPLEIPIEMQATWWQSAGAQLGFALAALLLALLLAYAAVQWRTRTLEEQRRDLERRVEQRTLQLHEANARLRELSYNDALTGLANRRRLLETLEQAPLSGAATTALIFVDVDHFKAYNDRHGHPAGDEALRGVARVMRACVPPDALVARYGGEEFACLVNATDSAQGSALAERIRAAVEACPIPVPGAETINHVTISAGVASRRLVDSADAHALLRDADIALYRAKREGRNCVRTQSTAD